MFLAGWSTDIANDNVRIKIPKKSFKKSEFSQIKYNSFVRMTHIKSPKRACEKSAISSTGMVSKSFMLTVVFPVDEPV